MLNIPSTRDDPNFRYKMPRLIAKVEGRGNGIKTNIVNMLDISKALKRMPEYTTKFCGTELGAQSKFDGSSGNAIVNGCHTQETLQLLIDKFIEKFVVCPSCQLPEIDIFIHKTRVCGRCNACGNVSDLDNEHKLATYIVRNPPEDSSTVGRTGKKTKAERRAEKASRQAGLDIGDLDSDSEEEEEDKSKEKKKKKKEKKGSSEPDVLDEEEKKKKKKSKEESGDEGEDNAEKKKKKKKKDEEEEVDGEEGEKKKKKKKEGGDGEKKEKKKKDKGEKSEEKDKKKKKKKADDSEGDQRTTEPGEADEVDQLVVEMGAIFGEVDLSPDTFYEELRVLQVSRFFDMKTRFLVTLKVVLGGSTVAKDFEDALPFLTRLARGTEPADILDSTAIYLSEDTAGFKEFAIILHTLYNADLTPEEDVLSYFERSGDDTFQRAKEAAGPFLSWLKEADEQSD